MAERKRRGLGRGLGALINSDAQQEDASETAPPGGSEDVSREAEVIETSSSEMSAEAHADQSNGRIDLTADEASISQSQNGDSVSSAPVTDDMSSSEGTEGFETAEAQDRSPAHSQKRDPEDATGTATASEEHSDHVSRESESLAAPETPERPIDVFFSAKSHLGTHRVSRGTRSGGRSSTTSRRSTGGRAEMPGLLSERPPARAAESASSPPASTGRPPAEEAPPRHTESEQIADGPTERVETPDVASDLHEAPQPTEPQVEPDVVSHGTSTSTVDGAEFRAVPVDSIQPNPRQPRTEFDEEDMAELIHSVREIGVLQPVVVREIAGGQYELVMGERRWRATIAAGRQEIPAIVRFTTDDNLLRDALLENIHRSQLNPLEEAAAYRQLLDDFNCTQDELASRIGRSRPQISNTLRLMKLPPAVQRRVAAGVLSSGHARALLGLSTPEEMEEMAKRIVAEGLSVRATEEAVTVAQQGGGNGVSRGTNRLPSTARYQQLDEYAEALTDRLDTQVKITLGAKKGRIAIDFGSIEDLHRLMEVIGEQQRVG